MLISMEGSRSKERKTEGDGCETRKELVHLFSRFPRRSTQL